MTNSAKSLYINKFLRAFPEQFTVKEFVRYLSYLNCKISDEEAEEIILSSPYVFSLENDTFLTRAGAFTGKYFSVAISQEEFENKCFLPGHRCMPFVDQEVMSFSLNVLWQKKILKHKVVEFSKEFALDHFSLFGEEYESQYIANDPGMADFDLSANDFDLPMKVSLTTVDLSPLFLIYDIQPGDRLLFSVEDWDEGVLNIEPCLREKSENLELTSDDILRNHWYKTIEKFMIESCNNLGPRASIEEQVADLFVDHIDDLCCRQCGSFEEFLKHTKEISFEPFGVETRLWMSGKTIPAIGVWNMSDDNGEIGKKPYLLYSVPDFVLDEYIKDFVAQKKNDLQELMDTVYPKTFYLPDEYRNELLLKITNRNDIILKEYNLFADHLLGNIRRKALGLYTKISSLVYEIDRAGGKFEIYPQQEMIILFQLYTHLSKLMETLAFDPNSLKNEVETISASLDGMGFNFEDIEGALRRALLLAKKNDFTVI